MNQDQAATLARAIHSALTLIVETLYDSKRKYYLRVHNVDGTTVELPAKTDK